MTKKIAISVIYAVLLIIVATLAFRFGRSQMLADEGRRRGLPELFEQAKQTDDSNPASYDFSGHAQIRNNDFAGAATSFHEAITRRPNDYLLWLRLGYALYRSGDLDGARAAYQKSITLAPLYSAPNRYMGRLLLKEKKIDEAFAFLRVAARSDDAVIPELLHLARLEFPQSGADIERLVKPETPFMKSKVAAYLIKYDLLTDSMRDFVLTGLADESERGYFTDRLLKYGNTPLARQVWLTSEKASKAPLPDGELVFDGGFETPITTEQNAFGWKTSSEGDFAVGLDKGTRHGGQAALRLVLKGKVPVDQDLVAQIVPTEKGRDYKASFSMMSTAVESYGGVYLTITDADSGAVLASSDQFVDTAGNWKDLRLQFRSLSGAVRVAVRRTPCKISPCPIYADLRIDDVSLRAK